MELWSRFAAILNTELCTQYVTLVLSSKIKEANTFFFRRFAQRKNIFSYLFYSILIYSVTVT